MKMPMEGVKEDDVIRLIKVFVPYSQYYHEAYYLYAVNEYGELPFGTMVQTSMGAGVIIEEDIPEEKLPNIDIREISGLADARTIRKVEKDWWTTILRIHEKLKTLGK